jgi:hypothetical protein
MLSIKHIFFYNDRPFLVASSEEDKCGQNYALLFQCQRKIAWSILELILDDAVLLMNFYEASYF